MSDAICEEADKVNEDRFTGLHHLSDAPVESDDFAGNAHSRTARALVETIANDNPGIRAIGLEGGWGSGKSTVIEIAGKGLEARKGAGPDHHLFTFDAWAHQGDPLRRSFLDKFVNWLRGQERITEVKKQEWLDQLNAKITRTTTQTEPSIQPIGFLMLVLAPVLPLGYVWLSPFASGDAANAPMLFSMPLETIQLGALILFAIPYIAVLFKWALVREGWAGLGKSIMLLSRISDTEKTNQFVRDEDPTSVEFGNFLNHIIKTASGPSNKLIIVLDNLDRLPDDQISDAWAMMRGLIGREGDCARAESSKHVWLIVPYDKNHLAQALKDKGVVADEFRTDGFIEKTFDVVLRVSPPLLVHWRDYFHQRLDEAFSGAVSVDEKHKLHRLLEYEFLDNQRAVTPRSVKAYINNIVSIIQQWRSEIPIECVALYVLKKYYLEKGLKSLIDGSLVSDKYRALLENVEWQKYLASLHYNVQSEDAYQVLIGAPIESALTTGSKEQLETIAKNPGFELVLGTLVHEKATDWATESATGFAHKCHTLSAAVLQTPPIAEAWNALGMAAKYLDSFKNFEPETSEGLAALISALPIKNALVCASLLKKRLSESPIAVDTFDGGQQWLNVLDKINAALIAKTAGKHTLSNISVGGNAECTCGVISHLKVSQSLQFSDLRIKASPDDLTAEVSTYISSDDNDRDLETLFQALFSKPSLLQADPVSIALTKRLTSNSPVLDASKALIFLRCLLIMASNRYVESEGIARLTELATDGTLLFMFKLGRDENNAELSAAASWCLSLVHGISSPPNPASHPKYGAVAAVHASYIQFMNDATLSDEEVTGVAKLVAEFNYLDELIDLTLKDGNQNSVFCCSLKSVIDTGNYDELTIQTIVAEFDQISDCIGDEATITFAKKLSSWANLLKAGVTKDISQNFLRAIDRTGSKKWDNVFQFTKDILEPMNQSIWANELDTEGHSVELLLGMLSTRGIKLGPDFKLALQSHAERVFKAEVTPSKYIVDWCQLPSALPTQTQRSFYKDILLWLADHSVTDEQLVRLLTLYPEFMDNAPVDKHPDAVIEKVFVPLISNPNDANMGFLKVNKKALGKALSLSNKATKELAQETIEGAFNSAAVEIKNEIRELAKGVSIVLSESSDDSEEAE